MKQILFIFLFSHSLIFAQGWERYYMMDTVNFIIGSINSGAQTQQTSDGGYISCATILGINTNYFNTDIALIKTDSQGDTIWQKRFNNYLNSQESALDVQQTSDGGYIVCGSTRIDTGISLRDDIYMIKTDSNGDLQWSRTIGDTLNSSEFGSSIEQTNDGGYIISGGISPEHLNYTSPYLVKTNNLGIVQWEKTYGNYGQANSVQQTTDAGYIIGVNNLQDSLTWISHSGLIKVDSLGNQQWIEIGPENIDYSNVHAEQTNDGGYISSSTIIDTLSSNNYTNIHIIKSDQFGNQQWHKTFTDTLWNTVGEIHQTSDGGYIICGSTRSGWGYFSTTTQVYIIKTDQFGNQQWEREFGDTSLVDWGFRVQQTLDGGYIIAGITEIQHEAIYALYLIKIDDDGNITSSSNIAANSMEERSLLKVIDMLGREANIKTNKPLFYIYDDGTVEKKIIIE